MNFAKLSDNILQYTSSGSGPVNALVQQEVANIIAKEGLDKYKANNNNMYTWTTYTSDKKEEITDNTDETQAMQDIVNEEAAYEQGWTDCSKITTVYLNSYFKYRHLSLEDLKLQIA